MLQKSFKNSVDFEWVLCLLVFLHDAEEIIKFFN